METIIAACIGLGLAASCGLRVFLPLLVLSVGARAGLIHPGESFAWVASWPAIIALSTATIAEIAGYYIPWVDNALDTIATPAAAISGALAVLIGTHGHMDSLHPMLTWAGALIGGGVATTVQAGTVAVRSTSTVSTAGIANPIISTIENIGAAILSFLAVAIPVGLGLILIAIVAWYVSRRLRKPKLVLA